MLARTMLWGVVCVAVCSTAALGATAHIKALDGQLVDGNVTLYVDNDPDTKETFRFEVIVDSADLTAIDGFEYGIAVGGLGISFGYTATESATNAIASGNPGHSPAYVFYDDAYDFAAAGYFGQGPQTLLASGLAEESVTFNPIGKSLGIFVITIDSDANAQASDGWHTFTNKGGMIIGDTDESLTVTSLDFRVVPEPATVALLACGALVALRRRRRA